MSQTDGFAGELLKRLPCPGEVWEVGVHRGNTLCTMAQLVAQAPIPHVVRGFDTFCGRPEGTAEDGVCSPTRFADTSLEVVRTRVRPWPFVTLHQGVVPETFTGLETAAIVFAYLDLDLYAPTASALAFVVPRLVPGGIVIVDDYDTRAWPGIQAAVDAVEGPWFPVLRHKMCWARPLEASPC